MKSFVCTGCATKNKRLRFFTQTRGEMFDLMESVSRSAASSSCSPSLAGTERRLWRRHNNLNNGALSMRSLADGWRLIGGV